MKFQSLILALAATSGASAAVIVETIKACPATPPPTSTQASLAPTSSSTAVTSSEESAVVAYPKTTPTTFATVIASTAAPVAPSPVAESSAAPAPTAASPKASASPAAAVVSPNVAAASPVKGEATFYGGNLQGGTCSFTTLSTIPNNLYGAAFSGSAWDSAANCGACVKVTGPTGTSITAMIVDKCPECDVTHLDLFQNAFDKLGAESVGILSTSYTIVPCGITSPLVLHSKPGTSQYYFSMQVVGANEGTSTLEVSVNGGAYQRTVRQDYNFFETGSSGGFGAGTYNIRLTSASGKQIVVDNVSVASDAQTTAKGNYA